MGDVIEKKRRDYSGLDADKATIPAGGKAVNDTYLATDTKILYFWDGVAWIIIPLDVIVAGMIKTDAVETVKIKNLNVTKGKAELGFGRYVPLPANAWQYNVGDLTLNGNWHNNALDFSGVVPAGATGIILKVIIKDDAAGSLLKIRHDATFGISLCEFYTQVANIDIETMVILPIESDRLMDYNGANVGWVVASIVTLGYFI